MRFAHGLCFVLLPATVDAVHAAEPQDPGDRQRTDPTEIIVVARREPGELFGSPPIVAFNPADISGYGAGDIGELYDSLGAQVRGPDGSAPVVLLNGTRISNFSELRELPPEALQRVEVYSGDVAVRLGYRADQRLLNFVLRPSFRGITADAEHGRATDGGRASSRGRLAIDRIRPGRRWGLAASYDRSDWLLESDRPIEGGLGRFRSLLPESSRVAMNATYAARIGGINARFNANMVDNQTHARVGARSDDLLLEGRPLARDGASRTAHFGLALDGKLGKWDWSLTGNFDHSRDRTRTDRDVAAVPPPDGRPRDLSLATRNSGDADLLFYGSLFPMPAGDVSATLDFSLERMQLEGLARSVAGDMRSNLARTHGRVEATFEIPLLSGTGALAPLGTVSASLSYARDSFSEFRSLESHSAALFWSPLAGLNISISRRRVGKAPSVEQLGNPLLATPNVRIFDFTRGETVSVTRFDGGNPGLGPEHSDLTSASMTLRPFPKRQFILSFNFTDTRTRGTLGSLSAVSTELEQAFPGRFVRDASGRLISIDARPVNFRSSSKQQIRWGFDLTERLGRAVSPAPREPVSAAAELQRVSGGDSDRRPRLQISVFHTWRLRDRLSLARGGPELDFLHGDVSAENSARARHQLEIQAGISQGDLGARLTGQWQSRTRIDGSTIAGAEDRLTFAPRATFNLKLFAGVAADSRLAQRSPLLRGARLSLSIDNIFNARPRVRDATGATPLAYQPAYLDPLGRVVRISLRKIF